MDSGRDLFRKAIEFRGPDRLPSTINVDFNFLHEKDRDKETRIRELLAGSLAESEPFLWCWIDQEDRRDGIVRKVDEWGVGWRDDGHGMITTHHPLEDGYDRLPQVHFPDPCAEGRFRMADARLQNRDGKYTVGTVWFTLFERLWMLRGFDNALTDPYFFEQEFMALKERILEINLGMIDRWIERKVDAVFFSDDWGSQRSLLIDPEDWRRLYRRDYARMFEKARNAGLHVWMHLCGNIEAILPDLVDIGLSVLNPVQPQAMDLDRLARRFGGHLCFNGGVDVQGTLITGTPEDVRMELRRIVDRFGRFRGGYIAGTSHSIMPETPLDNIIALLEALQAFR